MGLMSFLGASRRLLKLAKKPTREELWISIRISTLGIILVGVFGYITKIISSFLQGGVS